MKTLYQILDVPPGADAAEIRAAYRKKASLHHPDRSNGDHDLMQTVQHAYDILSDPGKRAKYDATGDDGRPPSPRTLAIRSLPALLDAALGALDPETQSLVDEARNRVTVQMAETTMEVARISGQLEKQGKALARLSGKAGSTLLAEALTALMDGMKAQLHVKNETLAVCRELLLILDDHEYRVDAPGWENLDQALRSLAPGWR